MNLTRARGHHAAQGPARAGWRLRRVPRGGIAMPVYQYRCEKCGHVFEKTEHLAEHASAHPNCPNCGSQSVQHAPAPFVAVTQRKS
ncbi:FmdB family zinc ribbon protein [Cupriavidus oxalaticus]|jgi:putative FmdB family regulatory protein|uniref:FmdB family zinc ribbon protein n=1 Tax=Cupriavidus oxalaticus TaxID=96344 RepID=UPI003F73D098